MTKVHLFRIRYVHFFRLETSPFQMAKFVFLDTPTKNEVRTFPKRTKYYYTNSTVRVVFSNAPFYRVFKRWREAYNELSLLVDWPIL